MTQTLFVNDRAGNETVAQTPPVNIDRTPPEAVLRFDPSTRRLTVTGSDALSGTDSGAWRPISVVRARWNHADDDDDPGEDRRACDGLGTELRTYRILDRAGNPLTLVERVHTHEGFHEREGDTYAEVASIQYGDGPVLYPPPNRHRVVWETDRFGALRRVHDVGVLNRGRRAEQRYRADFRAHFNRTQITVGTGKHKEERSLAGMVLLRVLTRGGQLVVEY